MRSMTEGGGAIACNYSALPSVACDRTQHLPLTGEDEKLRASYCE